jgi:hypothetical protein
MTKTASVSAFIIYVLLCLALWNLFQFSSAYLSQPEFAFTASSNLVVPLAVAIPFGYFAYLREK